MNHEQVGRARTASIAPARPPAVSCVANPTGFFSAARDMVGGGADGGTMCDGLEMGVDCVPPENDAKGQDKGVVLGEMGKVSEARRRGRSARTAAGVAGAG